MYLVKFAVCSESVDIHVFFISRSFWFFRLSFHVRFITRAGRHRVLKWAPFVFRIIIIILGSTSGLILIGSRPDDKFFVVSRTV